MSIEIGRRYAVSLVWQHKRNDQKFLNDNIGTEEKQPETVMIWRAIGYRCRKSELYIWKLELYEEKTCA